MKKALNIYKFVTVTNWALAFIGLVKLCCFTLTS